MILLDSSWFNTGICINNNLFLWYITDDIRYFTRISCIHITPITLFCTNNARLDFEWTNNKNLWCDSTCYKTKNLGERKWIYFIPQMTVNISDVFYFPNKLIVIKWTILVIKVSKLSLKYVLGDLHFILR